MSSKRLPCGEQMDFPSTFDEFAKEYGFKDKEEVYTNGSKLISVFRVKQWLEHISKGSEWEQDHAILKAYSDGYEKALEDIRAEIAEYGSIMVTYAITKYTKTDKGIEKLVSGVLKQAKEQVIDIIDKYKAGRSVEE